MITFSRLKRRCILLKLIDVEFNLKKFLFRVSLFKFFTDPSRCHRTMTRRFREGYLSRGKHFGYFPVVFLLDTRSPSVPYFSRRPVNTSCRSVVGFRVPCRASGLARCTHSKRSFGRHLASIHVQDSRTVYTSARGDDEEYELFSRIIFRKCQSITFPTNF